MMGGQFNARVWNGTAWTRAHPRWWDGTKWAGQADGDGPRPAVWGPKIDTWVKDTAVPLHTVQVTPADNMAALIEDGVTAGRTKLAGRTPHPTRDRLRFVLAPGTYRQQLVVNARVGFGWEFINPSGNPADVVIDPADQSVTACEHGGQSVLFYGLTFLRSTNATGAGGVVHGSGSSGLWRELIFHRCSLRGAGVVGLSHELGDRHILYVADSEVIGGVYQHTIVSPAPVGGTLAMWDNVVGQPTRAVDEGVSPNDLMLIRSGWATTGKVWTTGYQRTGSASSPRLQVVIDPASGITSSASQLVTFGDPRVEDHPILDNGPAWTAA